LEEKKNLRNILSKFYKENDKPQVSEEVFLKEAKKEMEKASFSYKSLMEVHDILKKVYKNILKKTKA